MNNGPRAGGGATRVRRPRQQNSSDGILGVDTDTIGNLKVSDLQGNTAALTLLLHNFLAMWQQNAQLLSKVASLEQQVQIERGYRESFANTERNSRTGSGLTLAGTVVVSFGVNYLSTAYSIQGVVVLAAGAVLSIAGLVVSWRR